MSGPEEDSDDSEWDNDPQIQLCNKFLETRDVAYLEEAARLVQQAIGESTTEPEGTEDYKEDDVEELIDIRDITQFIRQTAEADPETHKNWAGPLSLLTVALSDRQTRTGTIADVEEIIRSSRILIDTPAENDIDYARYLTNLAYGLHSRYSIIGAMSDLKAAIRVTQQIVNIIPKDHLLFRHSLHNLALYLGERFLRDGAMGDIDEAIQLVQKALDATPILDSSGRSKVLSNLGTRLHHKYLKTGVISEVERAVEATQQAVDAIPKDDPSRTELLSNLGLQLRSKYNATREIVDLEQGIQVTEQALETSFQNDPGQGQTLSVLGALLGDKFMRTAATSDLEKSISCYRSALNHFGSSIVNRIIAGSYSILSCASILDWKQAYETSNVTISLIPKLVSARLLENSDKQHLLSYVVGLASDAAAVALNAGKEPLIALGFIEQGRGVLAASLEEVNIDSLDLKEKHPQLADQFGHLRDELNVPVITQNDTFLGRNYESAWQVQVARRYEAGKEFDELVIQIRELPGFGDFLLPLSREKLQAAAKCGPIAVINVSEYRCDAFLIEPRQVRVLFLDKLSKKEIENKVKREDLKSPQVLEWLWDTITSPILEALKFQHSPSNNDTWPHMWWITTGLLSRFPLHAAGHHKKRTADTVLDRVMSSYSPSIKAMIYGRQRPTLLSSPARALLVAMEYTPHNSRLPFATREIAILHGLCKSMALESIEPGRRKQDIAAHLPGCSLFHFAGHGYTDACDPLNSQLCVEDGTDDPLRVADLLKMNLRAHPPFLAYLSACGTGRIKDEKFMEESIHLINGFLLAGFRHVIGTLWDRWIHCTGLPMFILGYRILTNYAHNSKNGNSGFLLVLSSLLSDLRF
ncbi:CHAT domain-containing protein [Xylariaceae sp. AK1471]|nr:CHAT domain-containing protein [Xylariaceae sp. AK1471]